MAKTYVMKPQEVERRWVLVDARGKVLGRLATEIALLLTGKRKVRYSPHVPMGDFVVVINAREILFTGKKLKQKLYDQYSGYPGGRREMTLEQMMDRKPTEVLLRAVKGMLPKNRLGDRMLTHLRVHPGPDHRMKAQQAVPLTPDLWKAIGE